MNDFSRPDLPSESGFPIARAGYPFIFISVFVTAIAAILGWSWLAGLGLCFSLFCFWFFRDPDRVIPSDPSALVSPADGKVIVAKRVEAHPYGEGPAFQISIFMSVFNVHVNRIPFDGVVREVRYQPGRFLNASLDKASKDNERNALLIETPSSVKFWTVQVAGLVARRIICRVREGDSVSRGVRFGVICFGSRLDLYLPADFECAVKVGEKTQAGTTTLGSMK
ncbi:phosphatidylserine decarboxylase [Desulfobotulus alkaliphilus]|uniref:Phosphatidylserine decarboxylase proenzyme n=1 Tax=Desulfobotulus alkaliphilus TaxID=622671 RepID=A0A562S9M4_9BACT|nr:phosphatidylserine decarboxylase family protein [Desulfobotulus alkaliphilus]TWI77240.1 phosphatidylserine decarboxylase [Desulfobotulus alkaliphilus]